jgi:hypothetical protein
MPQATQIKEQPKSQSPSPWAATPAATSFVINLCSSTSPVALSPPDHAGLKRFTFFVSRRREDGRERFRLHMGYFQTQEEAEKLLDIVREIYPGAWAGLAPGQRLRAAAAAAAAEAPPSEPIAAPTSAVAPGSSNETATSPSGAASAVRATPAAALPNASASAPAKSPAAAIVPDAAPPKAAPPKAAPQETPFELVPDTRGRQVSAPDLASPPQTDGAQSDGQSDEEAAARSLHEVRAAIASLDDTTARKPTLRIPELKPATSASGIRKMPAKTGGKPQLSSVGSGTAASSADAADPAPELTGEGTIALLESAPAASEADARSAASGADSDDKDAVPAEKTLYAVQLVWSVQPIDMAQVPQLAIFSAYTLYGAEGNRDGRRWYGLRLGFFTDAVSAKQVAHYVRSEFSTVSVVPVTARERERTKVAASRTETSNPEAAPTVAVPAAAKPTVPAATATDARTAAEGKRAAAATPASPFEFIDDKPPTASQPESAAKAVTRTPPGPRTGRGAPGKRAKLRPPAQAAALAAARAKPKKLTLEETLEILGASDLKVDDGRSALINQESAANATSKPQSTKAKPSRLGRLFERLSERIGN